MGIRREYRLEREKALVPPLEEGTFPRQQEAGVKNSTTMSHPAWSFCASTSSHPRELQPLSDTSQGILGTPYVGGEESGEVRVTHELSS